MATLTLPTGFLGLDDYEIVKLLGEGGMGKAFLARHKSSDEAVVVKTVHEHLLADAKVRQRFHQEIDLMRRFRHPNAVGFIEASPPGIEPPFIVMEYVRGITLDDLVQRHDRLPALRTGRILAPLCLFLQTAHDNGLLHRDLTPVNIMVVDPDTSRESIKVMDFGLARGIGFYIPSGQLANKGNAIDGGTPDFICPEQIEGRQVDHRGDLFSVGVLLYYMLTGHVPFESVKEPMQVLLANVRHDPPPLAHWGVSVPASLDRLVMSCLAKAPADRPASARALIEAYQKCLGCRFVDDRAFERSSNSAVSTLNERHRFDARNVLDQFEACMVEQLAAIKLRGFVDGVGGQVAESDAGVIKVRLPRVFEAEAEVSLWSWLTSAKEERIDWIPLELHMANKQVGMRTLVDITVVRPPAAEENAEEATIRKHFCDAICRELRAYLMVGH